MSKSSSKLVQVYRARTEMEAQVVKSKLEAYGIPSVLKTHGSPSVFALTVDGMAEVKIMVSPENAEEALKIVTEEDSGKDEQDN